MWRRWRGGERIDFHTACHLEMSDRGLEPFHFLDLLGGHASSGGAHVLSGHDGPVRVLETHIVKIRLLGAEGALELPNLLLETHAAAALLDGVVVESFAFFRERHEFVGLRVAASLCPEWPGHDERRQSRTWWERKPGRRFNDRTPKNSQPERHALTPAWMLAVDKKL